ncbi:MAG: chemotaxis protein CheW [Pedobacter sp.]
MDISEMSNNSLQILEELKNRDHSSEIVNVDEDVVKIVIVSVMGGKFAFYGSDVKEILSECEIYWIPGVPEYIPGLINVRGDIESVIDIRSIISSSSYDANKWQIVMAQKDDFRSGIIVDWVEDVIDIPASAFSKQITSLEGTGNDVFSGEISIENSMIPLLDIGKLAAKIMP